MDKNEYKMKLAQIEKLVAKKDYVTAAKIADGIDWRKVKSVKTLTMIADIYEANERPEECYEILMIIYDRSPYTRSVIYRLAEMSLQMQDFEEAISFYKEFVEAAPHDLSKYILKYKIYRARGSSVADQITILQEYRSHEYDEEWSYELACLYEEAGMIDQCIRECDELIVWFNEGEYVVKALELKMKYQALTAAQQYRYDHRFDTHEEDTEEKTEISAEEAEEDTKPEVLDTEPEKAEKSEMTADAEADKKEEQVTVSDVNTGKFSTINLQKELAKGLQFILSEIEQETEQETEKEDIPAETAEFESEILKYSPTEQPEKKIEEMLCVEEDGQLSLDVDETNPQERQITGQMTIEEILEAWEEKKRQVEAQIKEHIEARTKNAGEQKTPILFETGEITSILEDFIPRTPKDVPPVTEEEKIEEPAEQEPAGPEPAEEQPEIEEPTEEETVTEEKAESEEAEKKVTSDTASMIDAIERALAFETVPTETLGRYLTDEEEKIFAYFTSVSGMKKQLVKLLEEDFCYAGRKDSAEGNLIITGHPGNGKTTLAIDIVKAFQKQRRAKGVKLAKVSGDGLNKKEPAEVIKKLGGGAMVIERAGAMKSETVAKLSGAMEEETGGLLVILEDSKEEIRRLLKSSAAFAAKFNRSIDIPIFSNDELVAFGKSYAEEGEYYFDEMAVLALYDAIGIRQTSNHVVNITEVKELVDDAVEHAEKKSKRLFTRLSRKRIDEYGNKLLLEEDFED